jgi:hypothetical protein
MTRFISPPDIVELEGKSVLLVDFPYSDIEKVAVQCMNIQQDFDILLYSPNDSNRDWLDWAFAICDNCVVNLDYTINTLIKAQMVIMPKTYYVGNLDIIENRRIDSLDEYFKNYD